MRKIRFRAWDNEEKWMVDDLYISFDGDIFTDDVDPHDTPYKEMELANAKRYELMQFTGLKDKNGVEIYEGDIVCGETHLSSIKRQLDDVIEVTGRDYYGIRFERGSFRLYDLATGNWTAVIDHSVISQSEDLEVVGNIYENHELPKGD